MSLIKQQLEQGDNNDKNNNIFGSTPMPRADQYLTRY